MESRIQTGPRYLSSRDFIHPVTARISQFPIKKMTNGHRPTAHGPQTLRRLPRLLSSKELCVTIPEIQKRFIKCIEIYPVRGHHILNLERGIDSCMSYQSSKRKMSTP